MRNQVQFYSEGRRSTFLGKAQHHILEDSNLVPFYQNWITSVLCTFSETEGLQ